MMQRRIAALETLSKLATAARPPQAAGAAAAATTPRWLSDLTNLRDEPSELVYEGPFAGAVRRVKKLSLFSAGCALAAGPIILALDTQTALTAKLSIAATLSTFGVFTTGLMHWFTHPYVHRLVYNPSQQTVEVTNLNLFARPTTYRFHLAELHEVDTVHPLTSFAARGHRYYIDADNFPDKALLAKFMPQSAAAHVVEATQLPPQQPQR